MITDLRTKRIRVLSQWQTFLRVCTYKTAAKINWHRYGTKVHHSYPMSMYTCLQHYPLLHCHSGYRYNAQTWSSSPKLITTTNMIHKLWQMGSWDLKTHVMPGVSISMAVYGVGVRTDSTDSPDCLPILLRISVFKRVCVCLCACV